jgi:hypothetical protein
MPRRAVDESLYQSLLSAFREDPSSIQGAARKAGVVWRTAERAWEQGWPRVGFKAIKLVLEDDRRAARAAIEAEAAAKRAMAEKEREDARKNAIEARKQEGQMVQFARAQSLQCLTAAVELGRTARGLGQAAKELLEGEAEKLRRWTAYERAVLAGDTTATPPEFARPAMRPEAVLSVLQRISSYGEDVVATAHQVMQMERLFLGQPETLIGVVDVAEMTVEEAEAHIMSSVAVLEAEKQRRAAPDLKVLAEPTIGKRVA